MNRDTLKTVAGLVIIGAIVVATFLYGDAQRKSQLKHDAAVRQQQQAAVVNTPAVSATMAAAPKASAATTPKVAANTAPVQSPQANNLQGGGSTTPAPTAKPTSSSPKATPVVAATTPVTGASGTATPLPQTGPAGPLAGVVGMAAIVGMWLWLVRSRRSVVAAARR